VDSVDSTNSAVPWRPPRRRKGELTPVSGEDVEAALRVAEGIAAEADLAARQDAMDRIWASVAGAVTLAAAALTAAVLGDHVGTAWFRWFVAVATAGLLGALAASWWSILRLHSRRRSTGARMDLAKDIVGMLREVTLDVAERERWSYIRLEAVKLRLSAFPLAGSGQVQRLDRKP
jgi:hypothetical protein